ncbi:hypothetical protein HCEG_06425 [Histoplasma capsulatum var. duboisii H88]|uniref:Uncharacterized protein n=2 Tax=Ajellomyces capsulatus TaxID=5037 RepID=F0ULW0_AJEC8|nr:hypothetical protein HCDG_04969 [Histoplasma capsulatum H143]EGC47210.1 hypothetical protein HCEG_06425 [Histoplasma capsulatum var. duboisii H88]
MATEFLRATTGPEFLGGCILEGLTTCGWEPGLWKAVGTWSLEGWVWGWDSSGLHQNRSHCFFLQGLKTWKMELGSGLWAVDRATGGELKNCRLILRVHLPGGSRWMVKSERSEVKARGILKAHKF